MARLTTRQIKVKASSNFEGICLTDMGREGVVGTARLATGWTVRGSNLGGGETFCTRSSGSGAHPVSCKKGTASFSGVNLKGMALNTHLI
jgi:hypothetical protein